MRHKATWVGVGFLLGCAGSAEPASPAASAGAEAGSIEGRWAEYWSVSGDVPTEQHVFEPDGRWTWQAAPRSGEAVTSRAGHWRIEGDVLVLRVESEQDAPSDPPREERVEIGECPPNDEARALDTSYDCRSFGGRAFWRNAR